ISPFRAQADALESTILKAFSVDELQAMDLRVGTVHAFQGNERDIVIASLGIGEGDSGATWRFVEDPHLFAVLATRARTKMTIVLSAEPPTNGLVAGYLAEADAPPGRPAPVPLHDAWSTSIADGLSTADTPAIAGYPCGRHVVDVCAGDAKRFVGVESRVHPDGVVAHIERHMALVQLGWTLTEAHRLDSSCRDMSRLSGPVSRSSKCPLRGAPGGVGNLLACCGLCFLLRLVPGRARRASCWRRNAGCRIWRRVTCCAVTWPRAPTSASGPRRTWSRASWCPTRSSTSSWDRPSPATSRWKGSCSTASPARWSRPRRP